ncbi:MAG: hypothetical protein R2727_11570 [Bacteroidales bacterium]
MAQRMPSRIQSGLRDALIHLGQKKNCHCDKKAKEEDIDQIIDEP